MGQAREAGKGAQRQPVSFPAGPQAPSVGPGGQRRRAGEKGPVGRDGRPSEVARPQRRCLRRALGGKGLRQWGGSLWQEDTPVRRGGGRGPGEEPALAGGRRRKEEEWRPGAGGLWAFESWTLTPLPLLGTHSGGGRRPGDR